MKENIPPALSIKIDLENNSKGTELKVIQQKEREKCGRYVAIPGDKTHTRIFVRNNENPEKKIASYLERVNNKVKMWN